VAQVKADIRMRRRVGIAQPLTSLRPAGSPAGLAWYLPRLMALALAVVTIHASASVPSVTSVDLPPAGTYSATPGNNLLRFSVTFSQVVTVDDPWYGNVRTRIAAPHTSAVSSVTAAGDSNPTSSASDLPSIPLTLQAGGTVQATYVSGSVTNTLVFEYTVVSGNLAPNGIVVADALNLNGASITDGTGNRAALALVGLGSTKDIIVTAGAPAPPTASPTPAVSPASIALLIAGALLTGAFATRRLRT
jgi:hypothetical protein